MGRIAVTDGISDEAKSLLEKSGHEVVVKFYSMEELLNGVLSNFDAVIVRSATKITADVIAASKSSLSVIGRAGVGVDKIGRAHV